MTPPPPAHPSYLYLEQAILPNGFRMPRSQRARELPHLARLFQYPRYFGAEFSMAVDFDPAHPMVPKLEFQQFVAGRFANRARGTANMVPVRHPMPGGTDLSGTLQRDGADYKFYGDRNRSSAGGLDDNYYDAQGSRNRKAGSRYRGGDAPGIGIFPTEDRVEVDLEFEGRVVYTPTNLTVRSQKWTVRGVLDV